MGMAHAIKTKSQAARTLRRAITTLRRQMQGTVIILIPVTIVKGECLSDSDNDGVCNEFEVGGCTDFSACNYCCCHG